MVRIQRSSFAPVAYLLAFEVAAIVALQLLGLSSGMQVPWGSFLSWANNSPIEQVVPPLVRVVALAVAYWMFLSTALFVVAQYSRAPGAIRATSMFTLPSVRRVVNGAMMVSIATTAAVGMNTSAATAATPDDGYSISTTSFALQSVDAGTESGALLSDLTPVDDGSSVSTPQPVADTPIVTEAPTDGTLGSPGSVTVIGGGNSGSVPTPRPFATNTVAATTEAPSTSASPVTPTSEALGETGSVAIIGAGNSGSVPTPRPAAPLATTSTEAPTTSPTAAPVDSWTVPTTGVFSVATPKAANSAPTESVSTPTTAAPTAPSAPAPSTPTDASVLGVQEHRVVAGENLWTISRDALVQANGGQEPTEGQIRDYWLKVIAANRDNLRSNDPHWIFSGEVIELPALDSAAGN